MAEPSRTSRKDFNLTKSEVDKLQNALKDENFVKLLTDYARELSDPAKKAEYEREIAELERERGYDVSFIHPKPGYVIKVWVFGLLWHAIEFFYTVVWNISVI